MDFDDLSRSRFVIRWTIVHHRGSVWFSSHRNLNRNRNLPFDPNGCINRLFFDESNVFFWFQSFTRDKSDLDVSLLNKSLITALSIYLFLIRDQLWQVWLSDADNLIQFEKDDERVEQYNEHRDKSNFLTNLRSMRPMGWMLIIGDLIHGFIDGLTIGAISIVSLSESIQLVLPIGFEEFSHKLGLKKNFFFDFQFDNIRLDFRQHGRSLDLRSDDKTVDLDEFLLIFRSLSGLHHRNETRPDRWISSLDLCPGRWNVHLCLIGRYGLFQSNTREDHSRNRFVFGSNSDRRTSIDGKRNSKTKRQFERSINETANLHLSEWWPPVWYRVNVRPGQVRRRFIPNFDRLIRSTRKIKGKVCRRKYLVQVTVGCFFRLVSINRTERARWPPNLDCRTDDCRRSVEWTWRCSSVGLQSIEETRRTRDE